MITSPTKRRALFFIQLIHKTILDDVPHINNNTINNCTTVTFVIIINSLIYLFLNFFRFINPNPLGIFTRKYPESTKIHQFCHTQNAGVLNPSESASVDIGHILNPPKSTTNFLVDFGRFRIPCSHENLYSMLLHRIHQNLYSTCNYYMYNPSTNMTKQL